MAPYESDDSTTGVTGTTAGEADDLRSGRRTAARYVVPVAVVGVAAATIGLVPALASSGDPDLPKITAQQLIDRIAQSDVEQLSGTVKITTDLGLPDLGGLESGLLSGATGGSGSAGGGSSADPSAKLTELASGTHTLRVATDGPDRQKLSLLESAAEYSVIHDGKDVWGYDSKSNEVYHSTADDSAAKGDRREEPVPATPKGLTEEALKSVDATTSVTVDGTMQVAGRDAYKLLVKPKQSGSTVGTISVAVDAKTGLPLKFTLTPAGGGAAVVDAGFTRISFAKPAASTFDFTPPKGAKVTEGDDHGQGRESGKSRDDSAKGDKGDKGAKGAQGLEGFPGLSGLAGSEGAGDSKVIGEGWTSIAAFDSGSKSGLPTGSADGAAGAAGDLGGFLGSLGDKVTGKFGSGTVFSTRLVNALITDDGKVYVGAVTKGALVKAADADH
ncbi:outer membrane lipoprotein carrier protein LolA [Streptomyces adustus]|uniref:Outer membrane lipoprotein carrier protein LolA n=1 Tax=Streptomyces adustus TaxID=1609272 RepID=A0A5N8V7T6_9ACTN|nr:outer membrane lipoprotein carrier protein LolA [Streptomyces adustus]MPY30672.1 outer membrane lipoprotein carrier protein LolA [Streptomyces adustus]